MRSLVATHTNRLKTRSRSDPASGFSELRQTLRCETTPMTSKLRTSKCAEPELGLDQGGDDASVLSSHQSSPVRSAADTDTLAAGEGPQQRESSEHLSQKYMSSNRETSRHVGGERGQLQSREIYGMCEFKFLTLQSDFVWMKIKTFFVCFVCMERLCTHTHTNTADPQFRSPVSTQVP